MFVVKTEINGRCWDRNLVFLCTDRKKDRVEPLVKYAQSSVKSTTKYLNEPLDFAHGSRGKSKISTMMDSRGTDLGFVIIIDTPRQIWTDY